MNDTDDTNWQEAARCADKGMAELFFPPQGRENKEQRHARESAAKMICNQCVVIDHCLNYAVSRDEKYGIWGGMTEEERKFNNEEQSRNQAL